MRRAWSGLTLRGRGLLGAGIALAVLAWLFGQRDLVRVGVLVLTLPALGLVLVTRTRFRLACARSLAPSRVPIGDTATVTLDLDNVSRLPSGLMLLEDALPWELGRSPRFVVDRVEGLGHRQVAYEVATTRRGRFTVGPLSLRLVDPFGLCSVTRAFHTSDLLLVTPVVHRLPTVPLGGDWSGQGESRARAMASSGEDDVVPRDYHVGDDLRRVHWRATARYGDLMVRREEQPWRSRASVLLDNRAAAHRGAQEGSAQDSSLEWALSAAASIGVHLLRRGWTTRLMDADAVSLAGETVAGSDTEGLLLDALAVLRPSPSARLAMADPGARRRVSDGLVVAVVGALTPEEAADLARVRPSGGTGLALVVDVDAWAGGAARRGPSPAASAALLQQAGWRVAVAGPGDDMGLLWSMLARGAGSGSLAAGTAGRRPRVPSGVSQP